MLSLFYYLRVVKVMVLEPEPAAAAGAADPALVARGRLLVGHHQSAVGPGHLVGRPVPLGLGGDPIALVLTDDRHPRPS